MQKLVRRHIKLALLACLVLMLVSCNIPQVPQGQAAKKSTAAVPTGPFVQPAWSAQQIDELRQAAAHIQYKRLASQYVSQMSLDEELGQLIIVQYFTGGYGPDLEKSIKDLHAGGILIYAWQIKSFNQAKGDITKMQQHAKIPLLISTDEEGGLVDRLTSIYPHRPGATQMYESGDLNKTRTEGARTGHDLLSLGINTNLAPDVDVQLEPGFLDTRTFGKTPDDVIRYAGAFIEGMQEQGEIACIKHFPGLGGTTEDPHLVLPVVSSSKQQLNSREMAPFKHFVQTPNKLQRPGIILATDLLMPAIDPVWPAELSPTFITDILRKEWGYDGVISTDALYMGGIAQKWTMPQAAVLALKAGDDLLMGANGSAQMASIVNALRTAVQNGTLSKARVDEAVMHILTLKMEYHLMSLPQIV